MFSQEGKVFIVTGGNTGVGYELCKVFSYHPGKLKFLHLDLNDLESVLQAAKSFSEQESKLDVLWNNAGTGANMVDPGAKSVHGLDAMIGMHCVATLLFTELLVSQLRASIRSDNPGSTRVVWTSSYLAEGASPINGISFEHLQNRISDRTANYAASKAGTWILGREFANRHGNEGILSVIQNPGNLKAGSYAGTPALAMWLINPLLHPPEFGAYTQLYAGISPEVSLDHNGAYVIPWGRIRPDNDCPRQDIVKAMTSTEQGGLGYGKLFWEWCEEQWKPFML
ncbi:Short-chain dehydrogenase/reductase SDR [Penicillium waksmanii]|uniref:Short-chain dehydrogenase/reductase SDR n=1 Tax=Penicillium waksmanii TaxID=69791 RepID=UPI002546F8D7|nr:Short-chain dehydrogenase/reductase SDR [Penicillium waksmanii]KAJ5975455.1 Short-chain dehydrogenase/reductase SDR [Penicillium waksmanii]